MNKFYFTTLLLISTSLYAQTGSINNTLGSGGSFVVKDGSSTFLSLLQSTGNLSLNKSLSLPVSTSSSLGIIFKGTDRFIHDYKASGTNGYNTFVGVNAGNFSLSGSGTNASYNSAMGHSALNSLTNGSENVAIGFEALRSAAGAKGNSAVGYQALSSSVGAWYNSAFGYQALKVNTSGGINTAVGYLALTSNTTGINNTAVGAQSLSSNVTGYSNAAFGNKALFMNTEGYENVAVGANAMHGNFGNQNTVLGYDALYGSEFGSANTVIGHSALYSGSGNYNTAIGMDALRNTTGHYNTAIGVGAGSLLGSGHFNIIIGAHALPSSETASYEITLGGDNITSLRCNVTSISSLSDRRDKKNIKDLDLGLDFLMTIKPRLFNWDRREWYDNKNPDGTKMAETPTAGFIAQELDDAQMNAKAEWLNLVLKSNPERIEATPGNLLPILVKAIQELKSENDALKQRVANLESEHKTFGYLNNNRGGK